MSDDDSVVSDSDLFALPVAPTSYDAEAAAAASSPVPPDAAESGSNFLEWLDGDGDGDREGEDEEPRRQYSLSDISGEDGVPAGGSSGSIASAVSETSFDFEQEISAAEIDTAPAEQGGGGPSSPPGPPRRATPTRYASLEALLDDPRPSFDGESLRLLTRRVGCSGPATAAPPGGEVVGSRLRPRLYALLLRGDACVERIAASEEAGRFCAWAAGAGESARGAAARVGAAAVCGRLASAWDVLEEEGRGAGSSDGSGSGGFVHLKKTDGSSHESLPPEKVGVGDATAGEGGLAQTSSSVFPPLHWGVKGTYRTQCAQRALEDVLEYYSVQTNLEEKKEGDQDEEVKNDVKDLVVPAAQEEESVSHTVPDKLNDEKNSSDQKKETDKTVLHQNEDCPDPGEAAKPSKSPNLPTIVTTNTSSTDFDEDSDGTDPPASSDPVLPFIAAALLAVFPPASASALLPSLLAKFPLLSLPHAARPAAAASLHRTLHLLCTYHFPALTTHIDRHVPGWHLPRPLEPLRDTDGEFVGRSSPRCRRRGDSGYVPLSALAVHGVECCDLTGLLALWDAILPSGDGVMPYLMLLETLERHSDGILAARGEEEVTSILEDAFGVAMGVRGWRTRCDILAESTPSSVLEHVRGEMDRAVDAGRLALDGEEKAERKKKEELEDSVRKKEDQIERNKREKEEAEELLLIRIVRFYTKHNPQKLKGITEIVEQYRDKEDELHSKLKKKYGEGHRPTMNVMGVAAKNMLSKVHVPRPGQRKAVSSEGEPDEIRDIVGQPNTVEVLPEEIMRKVVLSASAVPEDGVGENVPEAAQRNPCFFLVDARPRESAKSQGLLPSISMSPEALTDPDTIQGEMENFESMRGEVHICVMGEGRSELNNLYGIPVNSQEKELIRTDLARVNLCALFFIKRGYPYVSCLKGGFAAAHSWIVRKGPSNSVSVLVDYNPLTSEFAKYEKRYQNQKIRASRKQNLVNIFRVKGPGMLEFTKAKVNQLEEDIKKTTTKLDGDIAVVESKCQLEENVTQITSKLNVTVDPPQPDSATISEDKSLSSKYLLKPFGMNFNKLFKEDQASSNAAKVKDADISLNPAENLSKEENPSKSMYMALSSFNTNNVFNDVFLNSNDSKGEKNETEPGDSLMKTFMSAPMVPLISFSSVSLNSKSQDASEDAGGIKDADLDAPSTAGSTSFLSKFSHAVKRVKNSEPNEVGMTSEEGETKTRTELPAEVETGSVEVGKEGSDDEKNDEQSHGTRSMRMQLPNKMNFHNPFAKKGVTTDEHPTQEEEVDVPTDLSANTGRFGTSKIEIRNPFAKMGKANGRPTSPLPGQSSDSRFNFSGMSFERSPKKPEGSGNREEVKRRGKLPGAGIFGKKLLQKESGAAAQSNNGDLFEIGEDDDDAEEIIFMQS